MPLKEGDLIILAQGESKYLLKLRAEKFHSHFGTLDLAEIIGKEYGDSIYTSLGTPFFILKPTLYDLLTKIKRITQIIYPKDIGYIILKLDISEGKRVLECGCGSGALTIALAYLVGDSGKVISYDKEEKHLEVARANLKKFGLEDRVILKLAKVEDKFEETDLSAIFLDVKEPVKLLEAGWKALKPGHPLGILVPTANQVCEILKKLYELPFIDIEVLEILLRHYKKNPERLRPEDQMPAHTGYLIFARKIKEKPKNVPN